jgi:excisionase family DNA binding protein
LPAANIARKKSISTFEPLLDLHEAALVLGMHWKTLEGKVRHREVPAFKVGKRWRFRLSSLNIWLENGIKSNTTDHAVLTGQERVLEVHTAAFSTRQPAQSRAGRQ